MQKLLVLFILLITCLFETTYCQPLHTYDVVMDEIMADPGPPVGLPELEWIEIRNRTDHAISLLGWRLSKINSLSGPFPDAVLQPDSLLILCSRTAEPALQSFGRTLSVTSFPSLSNAGDQVSLVSSTGQIIHAISYTDGWYQNELKKEGGWSLEMIDVTSPCQAGANWKASVDPLGGTPGRLNAVAAANPDLTDPGVLRAFPADSLHLLILFSETLDSASAANLQHYHIDMAGGTPDSVQVIPPFFDRVVLRTHLPLQRGPVYSVAIRDLTDCSGNRIHAETNVRVALPGPLNNDVVIINEILFNPFPDGNDYVEIYHKGNRAVNLKELFIANRDEAGVIHDMIQVTAEDMLFFPGDFFVLTEEKSKVLNHYIITNPEGLIEISNLPSYGDDEGDVILLNRSGDVLDELKYTDDWHHPLVSNAEGVALERITYDMPTMQRENWTSAASGDGYGTPARVNSQHRSEGEIDASMLVEPRLFSPDMDGVDDFVWIRYRLPDPGFLANITVYDPAGRRLRLLQRSAICGTEGSFRWDGADERGLILPQGMYIILAELFHTEGKKKRFKLPVVLVRKK